MPARLAIHIPIWKRPELTTLVLEYYRKLDPNALIVIMGSEGNASRQLAYGAGADIYVEVANAPLGHKLNSGMALLQHLKCAHGHFAMDGVVCVGSDDLVSPALLKTIKCGVATGHAIQGVLDAYVYDITTRHLIHWPGYEGLRAGETLGAGRCFGLAALKALDWQPWDSSKDRSMDGAMMQKVRAAGFTVCAGTMAQCGSLVCMKSQVAINPACTLAGTPLELEREVELASLLKPIVERLAP